MSTDIVIIGGGLIGSSVAYHLAASGRGGEIVVIEPGPTYEFATTPGGSRVIQDISSFIVEGAAEIPPALPPRNPKKSGVAGAAAAPGAGTGALTHTRSDDSLEVSWSKQLAQSDAVAPARPKSQESLMVGADPLEESHPPRVKLPVIGKHAAKK